MRSLSGRPVHVTALSLRCLNKSTRSLDIRAVDKAKTRSKRGSRLSRNSIRSPTAPRSISQLSRLTISLFKRIPRLRPSARSHSIWFNSGYLNTVNTPSYDLCGTLPCSNLGLGLRLSKFSAPGGGVGGGVWRRRRVRSWSWRRRRVDHGETDAHGCSRTSRSVGACIRCAFLVNASL